MDYLIGGILTHFAAFYCIASAVRVTKSVTHSYDLTFFLPFIIAPYCAWAIGMHETIAGPVAILLAVAFSGILSLSLFCATTGTVRTLGIPRDRILVASLGFLIVGENSAAIAYGSQPLPLGRLFIDGDALLVSTSNSSPNWALMIISVAAILLVFNIALLGFGRVGLVLRAFDSDDELALAYGFIPSRYLLATMSMHVLALGALSIMIAADTAIDTRTYFPYLMLGLASALVRERGLVIGPLVGALLVAGIQQIAIYYSPESWSSFVTYSLVAIIVGFSALSQGARKTAAARGGIE